MSKGWTLVTGAAKRVGADIARELASAGHKIIVHYKTSEDLAKKLVQELGSDSQMIQGDFTTPESTQEFIGKLPSDIHYLVNNVGNYDTSSALESPLEMWRDLYQTNFFAPLALIQALAPSLKALVNLGNAGLNHKNIGSYASPYLHTKYSLYCLTISLAKELAEQKVRVNMVSPGVLENSVDKKDRRVPFGRWGTNDEIARAVRFLLEEEYITGQNLEVAGGYKL